MTPSAPLGVTWARTWRFWTWGRDWSRIVSSWKWVANKVKHRIWVAMCLGLAGVKCRASGSERRGIVSVEG